MAISPALPPLDGETTVSWVARMARFHANMNSYDFLEAIELSRQNVTDGTDIAFGRLQALTGIARDRIEATNYSPIGDRAFRHRDELFGTHFAGRKWTTYCPACLLEDASATGPSAGIRVGRVNWLFAPIRTCAKHGIALVRRRNTHFSQQFQDMAFVAPEDRELDRELREASAVKVSPLQTYVERRFAGSKGPEWLDGQAIDQAAKACEMLGACLEFGAHCNLDELTNEQWDRAGAIGFEAASAGPAGIRRALEETARRSRTTISKGGPQARFGRLYQWLQFNKSGRDRGPMREVVRNHILDTMPVEVGTKLFGEVVLERRRHTIVTLSKATGIHIRTLNRALVRAGILPDHDEKHIESWTSFDAEVGEGLARRIQNSLPIRAIPDHLNCNRRQAELLVRNGILPQLVPGLGRHGGILTNVAVEDLDAFLRQFRSKGRPVSVPGENMSDVIAMSEIVRIAVVDIVRMVLDGVLEDIELLPEGLGFRSVLVNPEEVRSVFARIEDHIMQSSEEVLAA